jgi:antitoxin component of MazEF toxin-antitoxin module
MTIVRINRRGNSLGVNLPKPYLQELRWGVGLYLVLEIEDGSLRFRPLHEAPKGGSPAVVTRTEAQRAASQG